MATSPNFNWPEPDNTDLVKNGALAIRTAVNAIDTSLVDLKGGTTGQVLAKATNTDMDFSWTTPSAGGSSYSGVSAYRSSSQTLTGGAYTAIQWNAEYWDTNTYHDNGTNPSRFTVPTGKAGYYSYKFNLGIGAITGDNYFHIRVNGTTKWNFSWDTNSPTNLQGNATLNLAVGDYVELFVYNVSSIVTAANDEALCSFDYLGA